MPWRLVLIMLPLGPPSLPLWAGRAAGLLTAGPLAITALALATVSLVVGTTRAARAPARHRCACGASSPSTGATPGTSAKHWRAPTRT